ncbi:hypothetical protein P368_15565 [Comamonas thiooxydans]|nr:hypothetical protein P365_17490 [Comamonas thiooxydans]KGH10703.1 hypothetical protein P368_15565 [Comamonas thiooxydans]
MNWSSSGDQAFGLLKRSPMAPLLEVKCNVSLIALFLQILRPLRLHRTSAWSRLASGNYPVDTRFTFARLQPWSQI